MTGDWDTGLPYLAKGSDADLADAAKKDLAGPGKPADQVTVGNLWWSLGDKKAGVEAVRLRNRAVHWYAIALPKLSGAAETRVRKRIDSMGSAGQYALEFDGRGSYVLFRTLTYNGAFPLTIEAWVKPSREDNWGKSFLIGNGDRTGLSLGRDGNRWFFRIDSVVDARRGNDRIATISGAADGNPWTHVAAVYDGREIRLYVDGHRRDSQRVNGQHKPSGLPFALGRLAPRRKQSRHRRSLQRTGPRRADFQAPPLQRRFRPHAADQRPRDLGPLHLHRGSRRSDQGHLRQKGLRRNPGCPMGESGR